jgi:hypothetical protein
MRLSLFQRHRFPRDFASRLVVPILLVTPVVACAFQFSDKPGARSSMVIWSNLKNQRSLMPGTGLFVEKKRNSIMEIRFVRSGGFAGRATRVEGVVLFDDNGGQVSSASSGYRRELPPSEAEELRSLASSIEGGRDPKTSSQTMPDSYQYELTIVTKDGKSHKYVFGESTTSPSSQESFIPSALTAWIRAESQEIWEYRIKKRP